MIAVAAGSSHSIALCSDGTLASYGYNNYGQLGDNSMVKRTLPVLVDRTGVLAGKMVIAVAAGISHSLALCEDGTLVAWGYNNYGQLGNGITNSSPVPVLVERSGALAGKIVVAVSAGGNHSLALCQDGSLVSWGYNVYGQLGIGAATPDRLTVPMPVNQTGVLAGKTITGIVAGDYHNLAWCADGSVAAWGYNNYGQLGDNSTTNRNVPVLVNQAGVLAGKTVTALVAGASHSMALCSDGSLAAWGYNNYGQLGDNSTTNRSVPVLVNQTGALAGKSVRFLAAGSSHNLVLCSDGTVAGWGYNNGGQVGDGTTTNRSVPVVAGALGLGADERILTLAAGYGHNLIRVASPPPPLASTLAARAIFDTGATLNGNANAQGSNTALAFDYGVTTAYGSTVAATPATLTGIADSAVSAQVMGLLPGTLYHFRSVATGSGGTVKGEDQTFTTTKLASLADLRTSAGALVPAFDSAVNSYSLTVPSGVASLAVTPVAAHPDATIRVNGSAVASGAASGELALTPGSNRIDVEVSDAVSGNIHTYTLSVVRLPATFTFSSATDVPLTVDDFAGSGNAPPIALTFAPTVGAKLTVIRNTGMVPITGTFANLAQGQAVRLEFDGISYPFVADYFGGTGNDLVLQWANTRLVAWGYNSGGELGNGSFSDNPIPGPVLRGNVFAGKTITGIATGGSHSLALCVDGTLGTWGSNNRGQLGANTTWASTASPVSVDRSGILADKRVIAISAGYLHSVVLCSDGTLAAWGYNENGQLGDGTTVNRIAPVAVNQTGVLAGKRVVAIASGSNSSLVLCSDGTLAAWGDNSSGQLGDGSTTNRTVPVIVSQTGALAGRSVSSIAVGQSGSMVLCTDGTLVAWGSNTLGQFGNNSKTGSTTPVVVGLSGALTGKTIATIALGLERSMVLCTDGTLASSGDNSFGQLGNNSITNSSVPVLVTQTGALAGRTVIEIDCGFSYNALALCADGNLATWGRNDYGQLGDTTTKASYVPVMVSTAGLANGERFVAASWGSLFNLAMVATPPGPMATTLAATDIRDVSASFMGSVIAQGSSATVAFEYGLTTSYGNTVTASPATVNGSADTPVSAPITGLLAGTTYHFRVVASGPGGVSAGEDQTFTTSAQATLANLTLSEGFLNPIFASATTGYLVTVPFATTSIAVTPTVSVAIASVKINGITVASGAPSDSLGLQVGENTVLIDVDAGDGINAQTYTVKVVRTPAAFTFDSGATVPLTASGFAPTGQTAILVLSHTPPPGTNLMMVKNTGSNPIQGSFANLAQGQTVQLTYGGIVYSFVADYRGGTGNDLVLRWANSALMTWGSSSDGALGNGGGNKSSVPVPVVMDGVLAGRTVASVATGGSHGLALCVDGTLVSWGANNYGQLGNGTPGTGYVPSLVDQTGVLAGKTVIAVATGGGHDLALCSDGTLATWGFNNTGQLGNNSAANSNVPVLVNTTGVLAGKTVIAMGCGGNHSLVLCSDGTLAAWGYNSSGNLGNNSTTASSMPVLVDRSGVLAGKTVVSIAVGGSYNLALCSDGTLAAWGDNQYGQLGDNTNGYAKVPVLVNRTGVLAEKTVVEISAGAGHSLALCSDGTISAWGYNSGGQLGNLSTTYSNVPVQVTQSGVLAGKTVVGISAGGNHSLALNSDGTLAAWGANDAGQLGNGTTLNSSVPTLIPSNSIGAGARFVAIAGGYSYSLALVASPPAPVVTMVAATDIIDKGAVLNASVNANGGSASLSFEYGLTPSYGAAVIASPLSASGNSPTAARAEIGGLTAGTVYHFRLVATSEFGTTKGEDMTFTTTTYGTLAGLLPSSGTLSPAFSRVQVGYIATVPFSTDSITLTPTASYVTSVVTVNGLVVPSGSASGSIPLALGDENVITIAVVAADGINSQTYTVRVTRLPAQLAFDDPTDVPVTVRDFAAIGNSVEFILNHPPVPGARLMAVRNTGTNPIQGRFSNLEQGQLVYLVHNGTAYLYVADYHGGTGNDLVLHWANTRLLAFGNNQYGKLGDGSATNRSVPVPVTDTGVLDGKIVTDVKCGADFTVALCSDGTVVTWGLNSNGQLGRTGDASSVPVAVDRTGVLAGKRVVAIANGGYHVFALCEDGTMVGWGSNGSGQLGDIGVTSTSVPVLIPMTGAIAGRRVIAIAAGDFHSMVLCSDGTLAAWGYNGDGQLGVGTGTWFYTPTLVDRAGILGGKTVVNIAAGQYFSLALCSDGTLASWGKNDSGQLGNGSSVGSFTPVKVDQTGTLAGKSVVAIECGGANSMALCSDGTISMWGYGSNGALGNGSTTSTQVPVAVNQSGFLSGKQVVGISAGGGHELAWCDDGSLAAWGFNSSGQLGDNSLINRTVPVPVVTTTLEEGERIITASGGTYHTVAIVASPLPPPPLVEIMPATDISGTSATLHGSVNARKNFVSVAFEYGLDTNYGNTTATTPSALSGKLDTPVTAVLTALNPGTTYHYRLATTSYDSKVESADMTFTTLSDNAMLANLTHDGGVIAPTFVKTITDYFATVPFNTDHFTVTPTTDHPGAIVKIAGATVTSGTASTRIDLGVGNKVIPILVTAEDGITTKTYQITVTRLPQDFVFNSAGDVPVTADGFTGGGVPVNVILNYAPLPGTILTLVNNTGLGFIHAAFGNLAQGQRVTLSYGGKGYDFVVNYHGGTGNNLILQWADTAMFAWGANNYGQLGDNSTNRRLAPVAVDDAGVLAGKTLFAVSGGYLHSLALCSDGTLAAWGYNFFGQLGNNDSTPSSVPVAVDRTGVLVGKTVVAISAGPFHNLALCTDGTVAAWGYNNHGQLGTGDKVTSRVPALVKSVGALTGKQVVAVAAGSYHSLALCSDGTLAAWGYNDEGELGDGSNTGSLVPVAVALSARKVASVSAGQYHTLALCIDGTLLAWGYNNRGQLGNGSMVAANVPVAIGGFGTLLGKNVSAVAAGGSHSLALCTDGTLAAWGYNNHSQTGATGVTQSSTPIAIGDSNVLVGRTLSGIIPGGNHNLVRCSDGTLAAWGDNSNGQLGNDSMETSVSPVTVDTNALESGARPMFGASGASASHNLLVVGLPASASIDFEPWRSGNVAGVAAVDSNHNGISDLIEYAFGLNPHENGTGQLPQGRRIGDRFVMSFTQPEGVSDILYGAEWSASMEPGTWQDVPDTGTGGNHVFTLPGTSSSGFMRLKVSLR